MTLRRVWLPSPNFSSSRSQSRLLVIHTAEGCQDYRCLASVFAPTSRQASSQVGIDDELGVIGEFVKPQCRSWAAYNANDWGEHAETTGFASWNRDQWLQHPHMLSNVAEWLREESARYGVPLRKIGGAEIRAGQSGVCGHIDCTAAGAGGDHWDPGYNFPYDRVFALIGQPPPGPGPQPPFTPPPPSQGAPPWPGRFFAWPPGVHGNDVAMWQQKMHDRGWNMGTSGPHGDGVDGDYGPTSAARCGDFQRDKNLVPDKVVGPDTWAKTWTAPVT